jgi:predicted LPLAT superfamily acyltransferase
MTIRPCLVVPVYDHGAGAAALLERLAPLGLPVVLVNDGSAPDCTALLRGLGARHDWVELLEHPQNCGKGSAVLTGLRAAWARGFSHALQIDADGQHDAADAPRFLELAARHPEALIIGRPLFDQSVPRGRLVARYLTHVWVWIETLSLAIPDSMCGFRVYPLRSVMTIADRVSLGRRMDFDPEIAVRLYWQGVPVVPLATRVTYPAGGRSHFRMWQDNWLISCMHTRLVFGMLRRAPRLLLRPKRGQPGVRSAAELAAARPHWALLEERGVYLGLRATLLTYRLFGRLGFALLLYPIIAYYFLLGTSARRASLAYLARVAAQPGGLAVLGGAPGWRHAFRHMLCFGEAILDKVVTWTGDIGLADLDFVDHQAFDELCRQGHGGVLIASHLGNVEVCRALGRQQRGLKINVLVHTRHSETFNRLMRDVSAASTMSLIQVTEVGPDTAIMLKERVARGEFVVIVGDRTPPGPSARVNWVPFLGRPAPFPQGPFYLAAMLRCPVLLIFCLKRAGRYRLYLEPFCDATDIARRERAAAIEQWIARYAARLEDFCLRYPYQWFNFFDFWTLAEIPPEWADER